MGTYERKLSAWLVDRHGVATGAELATLGCTEHQIRHLVRSGRLTREHRGVFVAADVVTTPLQQALIACHHTNGVVSHHSAAKIWEFRRIPASSSTHVSIDNGRGVRATTNVTTHWTESLLPEDLVKRPDGIALTSPPRTVVDLATVLAVHDLESVIEQAFDRQMFTLPTLLTYVERLAIPGRSGAGVIRRLLASREAELPPVDSHEELTFESAMARAGLPAPQRQYRLALPDGREIHPDFCWPDLRVIVEVDHVTWHGGRTESESDKRRDRQTAALGYLTLRVTDDDIKHRRAAAVADVAAVLALRRLRTPAR